jgi:pantetheine-phosphate adenylyltransferase
VTSSSVSPTARRALLPGSYDPVTLGHVDVVERCGRLFDEVVVAVLHNPGKRGLLEPEHRAELLRASIAHVPNAVVVVRGAVLLVDVCRELDVPVIVKGVRGPQDVEYERAMALMNRHLTGVETFFVTGDPRFEHVSSSLVKQVSAYGGDVSGLVPDAVLAALLQARDRP